MRHVVFLERRPLVVREGEVARLPSLEELRSAVGADRLEACRTQLVLRPIGGEPVTVYRLPMDEGEPNGGLSAEPLRAAWALLGDDEFPLLGTARQKLDWLDTHRFCSRCASPTEPDPTNEALACPDCGQMHYPRIAPAVIVLVQRGREALLGRSPRFLDGVYSTLAGFVEPGETLEQCVHREIGEETGVEVENLRYFGSQSHPFPHSLMVGFIADWKSGEVRIDPAELEDARWFDVDELPKRPHPRSIAWRLIRDFEDRVRGDVDSR